MNKAFEEGIIWLLFFAPFLIPVCMMLYFGYKRDVLRLGISKDIAELTKKRGDNVLLFVLMHTPDRFVSIYTDLNEAMKKREAIKSDDYFIQQWELIDTEYKLTMEYTYDTRTNEWNYKYLAY